MNRARGCTRTPRKKRRPESRRNCCRLWRRSENTVFFPNPDGRRPSRTFWSWEAVRRECPRPRPYRNSDTPSPWVEKEKELGGNLKWLHYGFNDRFQPQKLLKDLTKRVEADTKIRVVTDSEVTNVFGRPGRYAAEIRRSEDLKEINNYGALVFATGGKMHTPAVHGYGQDSRVLTQRDLEAAITSSELDPKQLKEVAMIQCVGSRDEEHPYCSRICCSAALKNTIKILETNPDCRVIVFYRDMRAFGTLERYYGKARELGAIFIAFDPKDPPVVEGTDGGDLTVTAYDPVVGRRVRFRPDRVVLSAGIEPESPAEILEGLGLSEDADGFLPEASYKFRPLDLGSGIYACGIGLGPAFLNESMAQGRGAAMRASAFLEGLKRTGQTPWGSCPEKHMLGLRPLRRGLSVRCEGDRRGTRPRGGVPRALPGLRVLCGRLPQRRIPDDRKHQQADPVVHRCANGSVEFLFHRLRGDGPSQIGFSSVTNPSDAGRYRL